MFGTSGPNCKPDVPSQGIPDLRNGFPTFSDFDAFPLFSAGFPGNPAETSGNTPAPRPSDRMRPRKPCRATLECKGLNVNEKCAVAPQTDRLETS